MKKCFFLVSAFIVVTVSAPHAEAQQKYIGILGGANLANESLDPQPAGISSSYRPGVIAGVDVERWFNSQWGLSSRAMYVAQGHNDRLNQSLTGVLSGSTKIGTDNVETRALGVDLLLKRSLFGNESVRTYAFAGPSLGVIVSGKEYLNDTVETPGPYYVGDTTFEMSYSNTLDWSIAFGLGVSAKLDSGPMFFLDAGYWYGLTNLYEWYGGGAFTRDIRLTAGVLFPIHLPSLLFK